MHDYLAQIEKYINSAATPAERQFRKDETFGLRYGSLLHGKSYAGKLSNYLIQSQNSRLQFDVENMRIFADEIAKPIRRERRIAARKQRHDTRNRKAGL